MVFEFIGEFPPKTSKPLNFYLLELELPLPHDLHARTFERVQLLIGNTGSYGLGHK
jgi:hypothetical protein